MYTSGGRQNIRNSWNFTVYIYTPYVYIYTHSTCITHLIYIPTFHIYMYPLYINFHTPCQKTDEESGQCCRYVYLYMYNSMFIYVQKYVHVCMYINVYADVSPLPHVYIHIYLRRFVYSVDVCMQCMYVCTIRCQRAFADASFLPLVSSTHTHILYIHTQILRPFAHLSSLVSLSLTHILYIHAEILRPFARLYTPLLLPCFIHIHTYTIYARTHGQTLCRPISFACRLIHTHIHILIYTQTYFDPLLTYLSRLSSHIHAHIYHVHADTNSGNLLTHLCLSSCVSFASFYVCSFPHNRKLCITPRRQRKRCVHCLRVGLPRSPQHKHTASLQRL